MDAEWFIPTQLPLGGFQTEYNGAEWVVYGNPLDATASFRSGCDSAPKEIRIYASNLETINPYNHRDTAEVLIHDLGDLKGPNFIDQGTEVSTKLVADEKKPLILGGEHTITVTTSNTFSDYLYVVFDAHLDLRDSYNGDRFSHACAIRRVLANVPADNVIFVGTRAISMEEKEFVEDHPEITILWGHSWNKHTHNEGIDIIRKKLENVKGLYLSVDMDGFEPTLVPGVGNPEPLGLTPRQFFDFVHDLPRIDAADINELNPQFDPSGASAAVAARLALSILTHS